MRWVLVGAAGGALALALGCGRSAPAVPGTEGGAGAQGAAGTQGAGDADDAAADTGNDAAPLGRLVPWQLAPDGSPALLLGIVDTEQKVRCRPLLATDGKLRCLPDAPASVTSSTTPAVVPSDSFLDDACTQPIFRANADQGRALLGHALALPAARQGCGPQQYEVRTLRALAAGAPRFQLNVTQTSCGRGPSATASPVQLEMVPDAVLPPETWAEMTEADGALLAGRVRVKEVVAPDGTTFVDHLADERWNTPCALDGAAGACWPTTLKGTFAFFGDAACQQTRLVLVPACQTPVVIQQGAGLFGLGDVWTGPIFENSEGCRASTLTAPTLETAGHFHVLGAALDADAVTIPAASSDGSGRLRLHGLLEDGGAFVALPRRALATGESPFFDSVAGLDCVPVRTREVPAKVRCLPATVTLGYPPSVTDFWADAACTVPAFFGATNQELALLQIDANGDAIGTSLHANAVAVDPTALFTHLGGICGAFAQYPGFVTPGAPIAWDEYPEIAERNAPP